MISLDDEKWKVLKKRNFALLATGRAGSGLGSSIFGIATMWWLLENLGPSSAGVISGLTVVGIVILRPVGGVFVDRVDRRRSLVAADAFGAVFVGVLAAATVLGNLRFEHFVLAVAGTSLSSAIISPATRSLIPEILDEDEYTAANSVMSTISNVSSLGGPALAGVLLALFSYELVFALNAASYVVAAVAEFFITTTSDERVTDDDDEPFLSELGEGLDSVLENGRIRRIAFSATLLNFFASPVLLVGPALIERNGYSAFYAGLTETLFAVGTIVAGFALMILPERDSPAVWETEAFGAMALTGVIFGVAGIGVLLFPDALLPILLGAVLLSSFTSGIDDIKGDSIIQASAPDEKLGRIFGIMRTFGNVAMPLSLAATGFALEHFDAVGIFALLSSGTLVTVLIFGHKPVWALLTGRIVDGGGNVTESSLGD